MIYALINLKFQLQKKNGLESIDREFNQPITDLNRDYSFLQL
jgi:hypothetical protein